MNPAQKINTKTLVPLCYANGFRGVGALAKKIRRTPCTVWRAVRWPDQFGPTFDLITQTLTKDAPDEQETAA